MGRRHHPGETYRTVKREASFILTNRLRADPELGYVSRPPKLAACRLSAGKCAIYQMRLVPIPLVAIASFACKEEGVGRYKDRAMRKTRFLGIDRGTNCAGRPHAYQNQTPASDPTTKSVFSQTASE